MSFQSDSWDYSSALNFLKPESPSSADFHGHYPFPTPPGSAGGSPHLEDSHDRLDAEMSVSVSTTFFPGASQFQLPPDIALLTSDSVYFYAHSRRLLDASSNCFAMLLARAPDKFTADKCPVVDIPLSSPVFNLILHAVYDLSCGQYGPDFDTISTAVEHLAEYGLKPQNYVTTNSPLFTLLLTHAPVRPMDVYALAGQLDLYELGVATSSHMLSYPLATITDDIAVRVGPVYLKRLFFLHLGRMEALRRVLLQTPHPHPPTPECSFIDQKSLTRAWSLATAYLAFDARPDLSTSSIESVLVPLGQNLACDLCLKSLNERILDLIGNWSMIKRTI